MKFDIPQQLYDNFIQNVYKAETNENPVYAFKKFLHDQICELINKNKQITSDDTSEIKIIDIEFTFKNILLYGQMRKRAKAIKKKDDEKRLKLETKIVDEYSGKL